MVSDPEDIEALAAVEHESWAGWTKWMLETMLKEAVRLPLSPVEMEGVSAVLNDLECVKRWRRQMVTPYADLSEREKESDRKVAREKLAAYRP